MFGTEISAMKNGWLVYKWSKHVELFGRVTELMTWLNPLNPNIKIQILICYPYTFSIEVVGRICWSIN